MRKLLPASTIGLPLTLIFLVGIFAGQKSVSLKQAIHEYLESGYFNTDDNQLLWNISREIVEGTHFEGRVVINATPKSEAINIYVLEQDPEEYFHDLKCNCAYLGQDNIIICDKEILDYFDSLVKLSPSGRWESIPMEGNQDDFSQEDQELNAQFLQEITSFTNTRFNFFLTQWIIGHEIGHLMLEHGTGKYHFKPPASYNFLPWNSSHDKLLRQYEEEADRFVIENLNPGELDDQFWMWLGISNLTSTMYSMTAAEQGITRESVVHLPKIDVRDDPYRHPPWLIRLLDMVDLLIETYPAVVDESGHFERMRQSIRLVNPKEEDAPTPLELCQNQVFSSGETENAYSNQPSFPDNYALSFGKGVEFLRLVDYSRAIREFSNSIELLIPLIDEGQQQQYLLNAYILRGITYYIQGDYNKALEDFLSAIQLQPSDARGYNNIAFVYYELGKIDQAIEKWETAIILDPSSNSDAWAGLGVALFVKGDEDRALDAYKKALNANPLYSSVEWLRYEMYWSEELIDKSSILIRKLKS